MEHNRPSEANRVSATQEIPRTLWKPKVHYCIYKSRHLSLSWPRSIHSISPFHFLNIHFNIILPSMPTSFKCFPSLKLPYQNSVHTFPFPHTSYVPQIWASLVGYYAHSHDHCSAEFPILEISSQIQTLIFLSQIFRNSDLKTIFQS
jgi:hypothetical protein